MNKLLLFKFFLLFLFSNSTVFGQYTTRITAESILVLPPDYNPSQSYPILVLLPFTGGDAEYFFNAYAQEAGSPADNYTDKLNDILTVFNTRWGHHGNSFFVMLPKGTGSRKDHSWKGFELCFTRYEDRIIKDVRKFAESHSIDTSKVYLCGVSLGGDLSWALSLRNPEFFKGSIVMGSRCSYPPSNGVFKTLAEKGYSFFMTMGMKEAKDRLDGMRYARKLLDSSHVNFVYKEMPNLQHNRAPLWLFLEGVDYVMFNQNKSNDDLQLNDEWARTLEGEYMGDLEVSYFDLVKEKNDLIAYGDGLFSPFKTEFEPQKVLQINRIGNGKLSLNLGHNQLEVFEAFVMEKRVYGQPENIELVIPEQSIGAFKYRGTTMGAADSKAHGVINIEGDMQYLSLSFDVFLASKPDSFTNYNFFVQIK